MEKPIALSRVDQWDTRVISDVDPKWSHLVPLPTDIIQRKHCSIQVDIPRIKQSHIGQSMRSTTSRVGRHVIQFAKPRCKGNVMCIVESRVPKHAYAKLVPLALGETSFIAAVVLAIYSRCRPTYAIAFKISERRIPPLGV